MGNLRSFLVSARSENAVVVMDGAGDSTFKYIFIGLYEGLARALSTDPNSLFKGYMGGDNIFSQGSDPDGAVDCLLRRNLASAKCGVTDNPPAGCTGVPLLGGFGPITTLTTVGGINAAFTGAVTVGAVTDDWWADGSSGYMVFLDTGEIVACSNKAGTTITIGTRAQIGSTAAVHAQGAQVMCLSMGTGTTVPWQAWQHGYLAAAATYFDPGAGVQPKSRSPMGTSGNVEVVWIGENPTGAVVVGASTRLAVYSVDNPAGPTDPVRAQIAAGSATNPTTADAAGTLLGLAVSGPAGYRQSSVAPIGNGGLWGGPHGVAATTGNYLGCRTILHNRGRRGGLIQTLTASQGGYSLLGYVSCMMRTPRFLASQVRKLQGARWLASTARGGSGKFRWLFAAIFGRNDVVLTSLGFVVPGREWTIDASKTTTLTASYNGSDTTWNVGTTANLPTSGHGYNPVTLERFYWTGKTATTLTGIFRGDLGTSAVASNGSGDTLQFGYQQHTPVGYSSTVAMLLTLLRTIHNAADISQANASYPFATSGTFNMLSPETGVPDSTRELLLLWPRPLPSSPTVASTAGVVTTYAQREQRERDYVAALQQYLGSEPDFAVLDTACTFEDLLEMGGLTQLQTNSTLSAILNTGDTTASIAVNAGGLTEGYLCIDNEFIRWSGISGAGPYTYASLTRNLTGRAVNLTSHASGAAVGFLDPIHSTEAGCRNAMALAVSAAMERPADSYPRVPRGSVIET